MAAPTLPTDELRRLYEVEGLSLREIADRSGTSRQTVYTLLKGAGVNFSKRRPRPRRYDVAEIKRLYLEEHKSVEAIGKRLRIGSGTVSRLLKESEVAFRKQRDWSGKYRKFETLKIGESIKVPRPTSRGKWQGRFYKAAGRYGIRISIRSVDASIVEITRVG